MGENLDFNLVTPSRMIVPCPDLEVEGFSEGRNFKFVEKKKTFSGRLFCSQQLSETAGILGMSQ